ncbi:hypothetical protein H4R23_004098 [Coemansia sp. Cherry 401B]|nr:hypothetical protein H4R23_004098 [Coemansia sp. Cherry 401B]
MPSNSRDDRDTATGSLFDPFFARGVLFDTRDVFDMEPWPAFYFDRAALLRGGRIPEPPYARLLRRLGLFDPIELPPVERRPQQSTFPLVVHSATMPQPPVRSDDDISATLRSVSDELKRDGSRIIGSIGEVFDETSRWAMGSLLGQLRGAADHIESRMQDHQASDSDRDRDRKQPSSSFYQALRSDLITNFDRLFPEPTEDEKRTCSYYHITTRTMPDGSVETRKVLRDNDGSEKTTVIRHFPDSDQEDQVTVTTADSPKRIADESRD